MSNVLTFIKMLAECPVIKLLKKNIFKKFLLKKNLSFLVLNNCSWGPCILCQNAFEDLGRSYMNQLHLLESGSSPTFEQKHTTCSDGIIWQNRSKTCLGKCLGLRLCQVHHFERNGTQVFGFPFSFSFQGLTFEWVETESKKRSSLPSTLHVREQGLHFICRYATTYKV